MSQNTDDLTEIGQVLVETGIIAGEQLAADQMAIIANPSIMPAIQIQTAVAVGAALEALAMILNHLEEQ